MTRLDDPAKEAEDRHARTSQCRHGGVHEGVEVVTVSNEPVGHICPKCYDRVERVWTGWPPHGPHYVDYDEEERARRRR